MKKRYFYILVLFAIIPLLGWIAFNQVTADKEKYVITNESGDRKELGNVRFNSYDYIGAYKVNKVSIGGNGLEVSNADYIHEYASYKNVVENKDLLRGKDVSWNCNNPCINENSEYAVYVNLEHSIYEGKSNMNLNMKNKESGKIIRTNHCIKSLSIIEQVRIIGNFVEVIAEGETNNSDRYNYGYIISYKFELSTGKLINEELLADTIQSAGMVWEQGKTYLFINKEDAEKNKTSYMLVYDAIHDKATKVDLPKNLKMYPEIINDGIIYCPTEDGTVLGINKEGKTISNFKLDKDMRNFKNMTVNDNKIYFVKDYRDQTTEQLGKKISVYSLKNKDCLYSGQVNIYNSDYLCSGFITQ